MFIVHVNYRGGKWTPATLVRCPDGSGLLFYNRVTLNNFLKNRPWRYAK